MVSFGRKLLTATVSVSLVLTSTLPALAQRASPQKTNYEACRAQDETAFRDAIRDVTLTALRNGTQSVDYEAYVRDQWRKQDLDRLIDKRVKLAEEDVRRQTSWGQLLQSLASSEKANELALAVAEHVYRSDEMKAALEQAAKGVSLEVGCQIVLSTEEAATPARICLQMFLGERFGRTIADTVSADAKAAFVLEPAGRAAALNSTNVAQKASGAITGGIILLIRRQLARMARRIGQRVVGAVIGRVVSVVAGGIGIALIAYDLKQIWELRNGILPIIREEMTSDATKAKVRKELANAIKGHMNGQLETIADSSADHILRIWRDFKVAHNKVLELSASHKPFQEFVDSLRPEQLPRLDELVAITLRRGTLPDVKAKLASGTLHQAMTRLDDDGMQLARELSSIEQALAWRDLAPDKLADVLNYEVHRQTSPASFTGQSLNRILNLDEDRIVKRLAGLKSESRGILLELTDEQLKRLARDLDTAALESFAGYLSGLETSARKIVFDAVAANPARIRDISSGQVRSAILGSRNQAAAAELMLQRDQAFDIPAMTSAVRLVAAGDVHPLLIWHKHPVVVVVLVLGLLLVLLILKRLFFPPRRAAATAKSA